MNKDKSVIDLLHTENKNLKNRINELENHNRLLKSEFNKQKNLSDALNESKEKFEALYNNAPMSYQSLDENGYILDINPAWLRTLGYHKDEVIGKSFAEFLDADGQQHFEENFHVFKKHGGISDVQFNIRHKRGHYLSVTFEGKIGYHEDGSFKQTYCVFQDITKQKKIEVDLVNSENRYRKLFDDHGAIKLLIDKDTGNIVDANKAALKFYGWSKNELLTMKIFQINTLSSEEIQKEIDKASSKQKQYFEFKHRKCNGEIREVAVYSNPIVLKNKTFLHSIIHDITEQKQAEEKLIIEKEFSEKIIETSNAIIIGLDRNHLIKIFNKGAEKITGYKKEDIIGKDWFEIFFLPEQLDEMNKVWEDSWGVKSHAYENPILNIFGKERIISWQTTGFYDDIDANNHFLISIGKDITEQKIAEQKLKESKLKYKLLADFNYDWEYWIDPNGNYIYLSPSVERITGYTPEEFIENPELLFDIIRDDFKKEISAHFKNENTLSEPVFRTEFSIITRSGEEKWLAHQCSPVLDESGTWVGRRGNNRDITEQVISQKALRKSEYLLNETQTIAKVGGWEYRISDGNIVWTDEVYRIYGVSKEYNASIEQGIKFYHKDDIPIITEAFKKCINKGVAYNLELRFTNAQNKAMWVHTSGKPIYVNGVVTKVVGHIMDITERKYAEEKIYLFSRIFENSLNEIFLFNIDDFKFVQVNDSALKNLGYTMEEMANFTPLDIKPQITHEKFTKLVEPLLKGKKEKITFETIHKRKDKTIYDVDVHLQILKHRNYSLFVAIILDITDRKKAEVAMKNSKTQLRELIQRANLIQETERANISREIHDTFGQALTALKFDLSWIKRNNKSIENELAEKLSSMDDLISDTIVSVQKLSTELRPGLLDDLGLKSALEWQLQEFENRFEIETKLMFEDENLQLIESISVNFFRVVQESLTNIARHAQATSVTVKVIEEKNKISLTIYDNGIGINKEEISNVKSLGLLGIKERVRSINGEIEIVGKPNKGTKIIVTVAKGE